MLKMQQADDPRKIIKTTLLLNQPIRYMTSMFEKELRAYYGSLTCLTCLHIVLEEKSTTYKFLSFQYKVMYKQCPNEECCGGQTKTNQTLALLRM